MRERGGALAALQERGFSNTSRKVHRFFAERRTKPIRPGRNPQGAMPGMQGKKSMTGPMLPTSRQLAWLLVQPVLALDAVALAVVAFVEQDETAATVARLARGSSPRRWHVHRY